MEMQPLKNFSKAKRRGPGSISPEERVPLVSSGAGNGGSNGSNINSFNNPRGKSRRGGAYAEEKVPLVGGSSNTSSLLYEYKNINNRNNNNNNNNINNNNNRGKSSWTLPRLLRYLSLSFASGLFTFIAIRSESRALNWDEYNLNPKVVRDDQRCYIVDTGRKERCSCPNPALARERDITEWHQHHKRMVQDAKRAKNDLDVVLLGDTIVERWNGTYTMGTEHIFGAKNIFHKKFTLSGGGFLEGLALGSSVDTTTNMLWHLQNGVLNSLYPKVWFILLGSNDLFEDHCTDRFVVAGVMNVLKYLHTQRPDAHFIVHGILPRKDPGRNRTEFLGTYWQWSQTINGKLKKFCEHNHGFHYMQAGSVFMEDTQHVRGRKRIKVQYLEDGVNPTLQGLEAWTDQVVATINTTLFLL